MSNILYFNFPKSFFFVKYDILCLGFSKVRTKNSSENYIAYEYIVLLEINLSTE